MNEMQIELNGTDFQINICILQYIRPQMIKLNSTPFCFLTSCFFLTETELIKYTIFSISYSVIMDFGSRV